MMDAGQVAHTIEADERRALELRRKLARTDDLLTFQTRFDTRLSRRDDLKEIADVWEATVDAAAGKRRPIIALLSAPPQVGKTLLGQHGIARHLTRRPEDWIAMVTYASTLSETKSREVRDMVLAAGVELRGDSTAVDRWQTRAGGGLLARGIDGGITGQSGIKTGYICDPYKDRASAESKAISEHIESQVRSAVMSRRAPQTSIVVEHTRWTTTDLIAGLGKLLRSTNLNGAELVEVNLPAVDLVTGEPRITFGGRDREFYDLQRALVAEHDWWALYMGMPRAREGKLFKGVFTYAQRPMRMAVCIALDLAYTASQAADASCIMAVGRDLDAPRDALPVLHVLDVERGFWTITESAARIKAFQRCHGGAPLFARTGGQEAAIYELLRTHEGIATTVAPTIGDKLVNATPASATWNGGRYLVPEGMAAPWVDGFVGRVLDFSGLRSGEKDDEIDCLATAHHELTVGAFAMAFGTGEVARGAGRLPTARGGWL